MAYIQSDEGHVRLLRKLLNSKIWRNTTPEIKTVMTTLLLMTKSKSILEQWNGKDIELKPGMIIATLEDITYLCGPEISETDVKYSLSRFSTILEFIKLKTAKKDPNLFLIKILNWKKYNPAGISNEESEQKKADAEKLYKFYLDKINPAQKSKSRAVSNILKHMKKYSCKDLAKSVINYLNKSQYHKPEYRKDPANFFGVNEPYFKDFLPGEFDRQTEEMNQQYRETNLPPVLTDDRLSELNT